MPRGFPLQDTGPGMNELFHDLAVEEERRKAREWWVRAPEHDKRFAHGDDYAGDAWRYAPTGEVKWTAVNHGPPESPRPDADA